MVEVACCTLFWFPFLLFLFSLFTEAERDLHLWRRGRRRPFRVACFAQEIRAPLFAASFFLFPLRWASVANGRRILCFPASRGRKSFSSGVGFAKFHRNASKKWENPVPWEQTKENASSDSCVNGSLPPPFFKHGLVSPTMVAAAAVRGRVAWLERRGTMQGEYSDVLLTSFPTQKTMLNENYRMFLDSRKSSLRNNAVSMSKTLFCMEIRHPQGRITALFLLLPPR